MEHLICCVREKFILIGGASVENLLYKNIVEGLEWKSVNQSDWEKIVSLANRHKLISPLLKNNPQKKVGSLSWEEINQRQIIKNRAFAQISSIFSEHDIDYLLIKGPVLSKYYPESISRSYGDFDIVVKSIEEFWRASEILFNMKFQYSDIPFFTKYDNEICGVAKFSKIISGDIELKIEINIAGFIISEVCWMSKSFLWSDRQFMNFHGTSVPIPSDKNNFIILVAEAGGNPFVRLRDVLDYKFLKKAVHDFQNVHKDLQRFYLQKDFQMLRNIYTRLEKGRKGMGGGMQKLRTRMRRDIYHVLPNLFRSPGWVKKVLLHYAILFGVSLVKKEKGLHLVKRLDTWLDTKHSFNSGLNIYLIPISETLKGKWEWKRLQGFDFIQTPIGLYLASNYCLYYEDELEQAQLLSEQAFNQKL